MKKEGVIAVFALIALAVVASFGQAQTQMPEGLPMECDASQIIFNLSDATNAHAAFYNASGALYPQPVCYDKFFKTTFPSNPDPHNGNPILALSGLTNAHAENISAGGNYPYTLSYGDLECVIVRDLNCTSQVGADYSLIVSLSGLTNAHLTFGIFPNYPYRLCCKSQNAQPPGPICNNNGSCDPGETWYNCPEDCPREPWCGDGICQPDNGENVSTCPAYDSLHGDCPPTNCEEQRIVDPDSVECVEGQTEDCSALSPDYTSGTATCIPFGQSGQCTWDTNDCGTGGGGGPPGPGPGGQQELPFCLAFGPYATTYPDDSGTSPSGRLKVERCSDYEKLDLPPSPPYDGSEIEFRAEACNKDCADAGPTQASLLGGSNGQCVWDNINGKCKFVYEVQTGGGATRSCAVQWNDAGQCDPSTNTRPVTIAFSKDCQSQAPTLCGSVTPNCPAGSDQCTCAVQLPCPESIQLSFFGWKQFVASLLAIGMIYSFILWKREEISRKLRKIKLIKWLKNV
ncbi:hypothetical protein D6817_02095 [Candidatus Pacearchaeota archaeon]|nr:MAG: hypothetical protein D6817_02095 [Candidatus Pacearchaeota archaeon]